MSFLSRDNGGSGERPLFFARSIAVDCNRLQSIAVVLKSGSLVAVLFAVLLLFPRPVRAASWDGAELTPEAARLNEQAARAAVADPPVSLRSLMRLYAQAAKADPNNAEACYRLAGLMLEAGETTAAAALYGRVLGLYPGDPDALVGHAAATARSQGPTAAAVRDALDELSVAETAIGLTPAIAYFRSQLLYHLGDLPAAQAAADDAVRLDAEDPVSAAQTALYQQQSDLCSATIALLEPIE